MNDGTCVAKAPACQAAPSRMRHRTSAAIAIPKTLSMIMSSKPPLGIM
jgi:hypothetical protein